MTRFRTRLITAAGVTIGLFAIALLAAMQSADSQTVGIKAFGLTTSAACAQASGRWDDAGYYQTEYARQHCDTTVAQ
jgi:ABC-type nitrate/sulfonate/bicarbonate transport system substrate-binding protein